VAKQIKNSKELNSLLTADDYRKDFLNDLDSELDIKSRELQVLQKKLLSQKTELNEADKLLEQQSEVIKSLTSQFRDVTKELKLAATVQQNMLPKPLLLPSIHAAGKFRPAHELAGDGYDFYLIDDHTFAFYIVDVAGHGVAAALVSFAIQSHLKSLKSSYGNFERRMARSRQEVVLETITELNATHCLQERFSRHFTIVYGQIDLRTGELCFCQAGHPAPLICSSDCGGVAEYGSSSFPVGMFAESVYTVHNYQLKKNDRLVIYSDGITDCETTDGVEYGLERLKKSIGQSVSLGVVESTNYIEDKLLNWQNSSVFGDDVSLLVVDFKGIPKE